jgi:hypothetical protein
MDIARRAAGRAVNVGELGYEYDSGLEVARRFRPVRADVRADPEHETDVACC